MLRSVPAPAEEEKPERSFSELVAAIYEDPRVGHEARELLLAVAYAVDLAKREDDVSPLRIARHKLGMEGRQARYDRLIADDVPRYNPPKSARNLQFGRPSCEAPRLRPYRPRSYKPRTQTELPEPTRLHKPTPPIVWVPEGYKPPRDWRTEDGVCGAPSHHRVLEEDPRTGWVIGHWFCRRHKDHADRVAAQVREQNEQAPEPIPNRGGLLPVFFKADWEKVYRYYAGKNWEPPSYGLCADDWPAAGEAVRPSRHSRLRVVLGGADLEGA